MCHDIIILRVASPPSDIRMYCFFVSSNDNCAFQVQNRESSLGMFFFFFRQGSATRLWYGRMVAYMSVSQPSWMYGLMMYVKLRIKEDRLATALYDHKGEDVRRIISPEYVHTGRIS